MAKSSFLRTGQMATACGDNAIRIFKEEKAEDNVSSMNVSMSACVYDAHLQDVNAVAWRPGDKELLLASCSDDGTVKIWQIQTEDDDNA